jgi:hypothetical protein
MKAFTKTKSVVLSLAILLILVFSSCKNKSEKSQNADNAIFDSIKQEVTLTPGSKSLLSKFPTPFEVTKMLIAAKAGYISDITNSPDNVTRYVTENRKAINLGVYSADLSYSTTYRQKDDINKFLGASGKLADELGIKGVYNQSLIDNIEKNNNNKDSLIAMVTKVFDQTNDFLSRNDRTKISVLITAGGFSEAVYLTALLGEMAGDNTRIMAVIASQKDHYDKLISIIEEYKDDDSMKSVYDNMLKLKPIWENYDVGSGKKIPQQNAKAISDIAESVRSEFIE